jgi:radical SAM protein with 4Fe4S-binding SPASM domain
MIDKFNKKSKTFCIMPFIHINHKQNNKIGTCWRAMPIGDLNKETFEEIWNNKNIRRVRRQLLNNERPHECHNCWKIEDSGAVSYRMKINHEKNAKERSFCEHLHELNEKSMEMPYKIPYTEIRLSNECNLHCRMCGPRFSSCWEKSWQKNPELREYIKRHASNSYGSYGLKDETGKFNSNTNKKIFNFIKANTLHLKYLMIGGGEPVLQKGHYDILKFLEPHSKNITLEYTSNLSQLSDGNNSILNYWPNFKSIHLKVSLDGDREIYPYVCRNGNSELVSNNIKEVMNKMDNKKIYLSLTCTTSVYNIERLPEAMNWFIELGGWVHTSLVLFPEFLSVQILPSELKKKITKKIDLFLSDLRNNIKWDSNKKWENKEFKKLQKKRIVEFVQNCVNFMNGENRSENWRVFLGFNDILDGRKNSILKIYPHWKKYIE